MKQEQQEATTKRKFIVNEIYGVKVLEDGTINLDEVREKLVDCWNAVMRQYAKDAKEAGGEQDEFSETNEPIRYYGTENELAKLKTLIGLLCSMQMPEALKVSFVMIDDLFEEE